MTGADHSEKANRLNDWVQVSLYDALKQGYAKKFIFGIASDQDARNLLEEVRSTRDVSLSTCHPCMLQQSCLPLTSASASNSAVHLPL